MLTLIFFIAAIFWGMGQMYSGEWTTGFILWLLAFNMIQAANAHTEGEASRRMGVRNGSKLDEHTDLLERIIRGR